MIFGTRYIHFCIDEDVQYLNLFLFLVADVIIKVLISLYGISCILFARFSFIVPSRGLGSSSPYAISCIVFFDRSTSFI